MEKIAKKIIVQRNEYERCCFPDLEISKISEKDIKVESPAEFIEAMKKIVEKENK